ncbi:opine metallophore biosynthesis dehydrogenase [Halobacillus kuroshimensis]|uniref:opine metallophore biosynthesis dehydrogenase n=1 Tax=Halobacillus kuroshimensis TaxID=302481 RepID=UPI000414A111|nr:opine metallophore biosynthesis dehydrogenase [Halobacillus kuroshimensis]
MKGFNRVLILGTGPTAIQLALNFKAQMNSYIGIAGRESVRSETFYSDIEKNDFQLRVSVQNEKHKKMEGECRIDQLYKGIDTVEGNWETLILSVTTDAYIDVLRQVHHHVLEKVKYIVLVSPTLGSNHLLRSYMNEHNSDAEIISFSTYFGDTRWVAERPSNHVLTTAVKEKVFIGSSHYNSDYVNKLCFMYKEIGLQLEVMKSPIEAETRNISLYVHPPLFMNDFSLDAIFGDTETKKYVYKVYPEGPVTQYLVREMLSQWKEIMNVLKKLRINGINLLQFMTDDNYPVRQESLSRNDIENFNSFDDIHQEYLLYIRYTSLLVDPFSEPDAQGRYFDFSAVPIRRVFVNKEGYLDVPRMPKEDYYRIKIIHGIAEHLNVPCPTIEKFISKYESKLKDAANSQDSRLLSDAFIVNSFETDIKMICSEI